MDLCRSIFEAITDMHLLGASQHLHFGAQDNDWEVNHAVRLGLPLAAYRLLWVSLGEIPPTPFDIEKKKKKKWVVMKQRLGALANTGCRNRLHASTCKSIPVRTVAGRTLLSTVNLKAFCNVILSTPTQK